MLVENVLMLTSAPTEPRTVVILVSVSIQRVHTNVLVIAVMKLKTTDLLCAQLQTITRLATLSIV